MKWTTTEWNRGVVLTPSIGGIFEFQIPFAPGHVNYLTRPHAPVAIGKIITIRYDMKFLSGHPVLMSLDPSPVPPGLRPNVRPMLAHATLVNRWWPQGANCGFLIQEHNIITVPILPEYWQDVNGKGAKQNPKDFKNLVKNDMQIIALTFGGGNSFGHGVYCQGGKALFQLKEFSIQ